MSQSKIQWQHKKAKAARYSARDLKNLLILPENSAESLRSRRERWSYVVCLWEYIQKLSSSRKGHSWSISHSQGECQAGLHACTSIPEVYWRKQLNWQAHLELCYKNPDILKRVLYWITLSNSTSYKEVCTHRIWKNFNNQGIKKILLSDELWLLANNYYSQELTQQSKIKSIKTKYFQIYVGVHVGNPQIRKWYKNIDLARKHVSNKLIIFWSNRKTKKTVKFHHSVEKGHVWNMPFNPFSPEYLTVTFPD